MQLQYSSERDVWAALSRIERCDEQLGEVLALMRDRAPKELDEAGAVAGP
jgi:hypothetical protein